MLNITSLRIKCVSQYINIVFCVWFTVQSVQLSYKDSGVDIFAGDEMVQQIKPLAKSTHRPGVIGGLGGFGGLFRLNEVHSR